MSSISKDYIFTTEDEKLQFVGDFDGLYQSEDNPWGQDGSDSRLGEYYKYSRNTIVEKINQFNQYSNMLEIGCGLGYVVDFFNKESNLKCDGADISAIALQKAKHAFPQYNFLHLDIHEQNLKLDFKYDVIVLNQVLWYVLEAFGNVFENVFKMLNKDGVFIISQSFLEEQNYGKEVVNGFGGLIQYIEENQQDKFTIIDAQMTKKETMLYTDGCVVMRKRDD